MIRSRTARLRSLGTALALAATLLAAVACSPSHPGSPSGAPTTDGDPDDMASMPGMPATPAGPQLDAATKPGALLPGMPPPLDPHDLYAADRPGRLSDVVKNDRPLVWVPNTESDTVSVIDPTTYQVIRTIKVGRQPQHVVPSWDLRTLWVNNDKGNTLTPIDPATGNVGTPVSVHDPYNLYFTPDGKYAVVMASADHQIVFRDAHTMAVVKAVHVDCAGVNHADFSPDGRYFIVSCEFSGELIKVDTLAQRVIGEMRLPIRYSMPQDVKISPDGKTWYVADMQASGVWILDGDRFTTPRLLRTGAGAHGLYVSRDSRYLYISNRGEGSISLLDFHTGQLVAKWKLPGGGSPDMGGVSADGRVLWLSGRYNGVVYAIDTSDGHQIARVKVGSGPHGLAVYPQPGRYSLGHTGVFR